MKNQKQKILKAAGAVVFLTLLALNLMFNVEKSSFGTLSLQSLEAQAIGPTQEGGGDNGSYYAQIMIYAGGWENWITCSNAHPITEAVMVSCEGGGLLPQCSGGYYGEFGRGNVGC